MDNLLKTDPNTFPEGYKQRLTKVKYLVGNGGLGDVICQASALRYISETQPHVHGKILCNKYFMEVLERLVPKMEVEEMDIEKLKEDGWFFLQAKSDTISAVSMHLLDIGWQYFCRTTPDMFPEWNVYPTIDLSDIEVEGLPERYAVLTCGAREKNRTMTPEAFNGIKDHIISMGITPVFVGSENIPGHRKAYFSVEYDYSGGYNLINKTSHLEAAKVIEGAEFIVGLDNGLLHLAGCMETPIVFGYTIASPEHRRPRRHKGKIVDVVPNEDLSCRFCQSRLRFIDHQFQKCLVDSNECTKLLTAEKFIEGIQKLEN